MSGDPAHGGEPFEPTEDQIVDEDTDGTPMTAKQIRLMKNAMRVGQQIMRTDREGRPIDAMTGNIIKLPPKNKIRAKAKKKAKARAARKNKKKTR